MVAGEAARKALWHRLGVQVRDAVSSAEAITLASLNWRVEKVPTAYTWGDEVRPMPDVFALVRGDTGAHLGTVGNRYQVIQNAEAFAFMDAVLAEHGARYETAGAIYGGAKVWLQVSLARSGVHPGRRRSGRSYGAVHQPARRVRGGPVHPDQ